VLHGTGFWDGSDLDLLVDALPGATLLDRAIEEELNRCSALTSIC
jgi:predicted nucleotidyltransferase